MRARDSVITARREALERTLAGRFWLRGHLALMLVAALASGLIADYALLGVPVHAASLRWVPSVLVGYAIFFVALRVWLAYVGARPLGKLDVDGFDDFGLGGGVGGGRAPVSAGARTSEVLPFGGGGQSGGAGASASFGESPGAFATPRVGAVVYLLVMVLVAGLVFSHYFPGARTLGEAWLLVHT